jgi:hypothetical protein
MPMNKERQIEDKVIEKKEEEEEKPLTPPRKLAYVNLKQSIFFRMF